MQRRVSIVFVLALAALIGMETGGFSAKFNKVVDLGDAAPGFEKLPGTDGKEHSLADFKSAKAVVIVFTCNHCPVASIYEERMTSLVNDYKEKGVELIAISVSKRADDSLEKMKERATQKKLPYPYVQDASQDIGRAYGATATPQIFVLDAQRKIAYMGAFDDSITPSKVESHYVRDALDAVLAGKKPEIGESRQIGCGIEYEKKN